MLVSSRCRQQSSEWQVLFVYCRACWVAAAAGQRVDRHQLAAKTNYGAWNSLWALWRRWDPRWKMMIGQWIFKEAINEGLFWWFHCATMAAAATSLSVNKLLTRWRHWTQWPNQHDVQDHFPLWCQKSKLTVKLRSCWCKTDTKEEEASFDFASISIDGFWAAEIDVSPKLMTPATCQCQANWYLDHHHLLKKLTSVDVKQLTKHPNLTSN